MDDSQTRSRVEARSFQLGDFSLGDDFELQQNEVLKRKESKRRRIAKPCETFDYDDLRE